MRLRWEPRGTGGIVRWAFLAHNGNVWFYPVISYSKLTKKLYALANPGYFNQ